MKYKIPQCLPPAAVTPLSYADGRTRRALRREKERQRAKAAAKKTIAQGLW